MTTSLSDCFSSPGLALLHHISHSNQYPDNCGNNNDGALASAHREQASETERHIAALKVLLAVLTGSTIENLPKIRNERREDAV